MKKVNVRGEGQLKKIMLRKVRNFGGSHYICLPKPFCLLHQIKEGSEMALIVGESLRITPVMKGE